MNFLNFLTSTESALTFGLASQDNGMYLEGSAFRKVAEEKKIQVIEPINKVPEEIDAILQERQKLINQYLQLNIKLLQKQIEVEGHPDQSLNESQIVEGKKKMKKNECGHSEKPHYAKGMCANCYHRFGRVKRPWKCGHNKLYAAGMCQNCYINEYNKKRRDEEKEKIDDTQKDRKKDNENKT